MPPPRSTPCSPLSARDRDGPFLDLPSALRLTRRFGAALRARVKYPCHQRTRRAAVTLKWGHQDDLVQRVTMLVMRAPEHRRGRTR